MWWRGLFRRKEIERELEDEINSHLAMEAQQRIERGESAADAYSNARKDFGSVSLVKDVARDTWGRRWLDEIVHNLFVAPRVLRKYWKLTSIAILSLSIAMTMGVITVSVGNTFLLLPPSANDPDRLVMIYSHTPKEDIGQVSYPDYKYYREHNHVFTDIAASPNSIGVSETDWGQGMLKMSSRPVSDNYFEVLGIRPQLGSFFSPGADREKTVSSVMTYSAWQRIGADPKIVGKNIGNNLIVGVAPKEFTGSMYGVNGDLLTSFASADDHSNSWFEQRDVRRLMLIARLKPGVTRRQAQAEMTALSAQLASAYPKENKDLTALVTRATLLPPDGIPEAELMIGALTAGVCLVLLIACANVANLLLTIAIGRRQEAAIKLALGIQRARLVREFLTETALICGVSAVLGIFAASFLISHFSDVRFDFPGLGGSYAFGTNLHIDATVVALTFGIMIIAIAVSGIVPALYASAPNLAHILSGEIVVGGTRKNFRRNLLVIAEVAVCTTVMVGMGLCERSLYNLRHADTGFTTRNLIAMTLVRPEEPSGDRWKQFYPRVRQSISSLPGVESISFAQNLPLLFGYSQGQAQIPGNDQKMTVSETSVDDRYFATLGIQIISGRPFDSVEREPAQQVVMINHTLAENAWPGQEAVGKTILAHDPPRPLLVIGVTADGKYSSVYESPQSVIYYPLNTRDLNSVTVVARTQGDPRLWIQSVDQTMRALGAVGPWHPITYGEWSDFSLLGERIAAGVLAVISGLGLLLAMLGLFCTISYSVSQRKKEFGIRVALGAERRQLLHMILQQTSMITGAGVAIGVVFGIAATLLLRAQFYGISPVEWAVLVPVSVAMLGVSLFVAYWSARPWISIDPMEAVRHA